MIDGTAAEEAVREYLDRCIEHWREERDRARSFRDEHSAFPNIESTEELKAHCYIDAFQSVKTSLFGEQGIYNGYRIRNN